MSGASLSADDLIALRPLALGNGAPARSVSRMPGGQALRRRGQGQELNDIRAYAPGDDIRHLDAQSTARTGSLHVKTFHDERDRTLVLVADFRPSMLWGLRRAFRSVAAAEALALAGWQTVEAGGRVAAVALTVAGPVLAPPRAGVRGMLAAIAALTGGHAAALAAPGAPEPPLDRLLAGVARVAPRGADLLLASGFDTPGADLAAELSRIDRRAPVTLWQVGDGAEGLPPGRYPIVSPEGQRRMLRLDRPVALSPLPGLAGWPVWQIDPSWPVARLAAMLGGGHGPG